MKRLLAEVIVGALLVTSTAHATPWPSTGAQLDLDGNCVDNFNDGLIHMSIVLGFRARPDGFPTCRDWYPTYTPTPPPTETPLPGA